MTSLFQAGALIGFLQGIYDGDCTYAKLAQKGNIGLGTFNAVDGEMIAVDGVFYKIDAQGEAHVAEPEECTPFALVSPFQSVKPVQINHVENLAALNVLLNTYLNTQNIFYMIRIDGEFDWIKLRSESCQFRPYLALSETLPKLQNIFERTNSRGTLVATYCPSYLAAVTIPGFHYHYIDEKKITGGHVFDIRIKSAQVMINPIRQFELALINSSEFDQINLDIDLQDALKKIE